MDIENHDMTDNKPMQAGGDDMNISSTNGDIKRPLKESPAHVNGITESGDKGKSEHRDKHSHGHHHSSSKHKHKDKDRDRDRHHHSSSSSKHRDSSSSKHKSSSSSSSHRHSSSGSGHKSSSSSSSKHHSSSSSKDRNRDKDRHSSSSSKHHSSSSSKHSSSSSSKHNSSSSKDKDRHSSSSKDKDGHRHSSSSSKHKDHKSHKSSHREKERDGIKEELNHVKSEPQLSDVKSEPLSPPHYDLAVKSEPVKAEPMQEDLNYSMSSIRSSPVKRPLESDDDDDDVPLSARMGKQNQSYKEESDSEDDAPLASRTTKKVKKSISTPEVKRKATPVSKPKKKLKSEKVESPKKKAKQVKEEPEKWKWWEEQERKDDGTKWKFLEHKGPMFAAPYERLPSGVKFYYNGKEMKLTEETEEVATFYGRMIDHDYVTKETFNTNFFRDWRKVMTQEERSIITDLSKCNFKEIDAYFKHKSEQRKAMSKEEKNKIKEENAALQEEYGYCIIDGHREKIGNFRIEPPSLFRGRGTHPKMGYLKKRVVAEQVIINCSRDAQVPKPPPGHKWKEVRHDNKVTWLASWTENVQNSVKYVMLNPASKLKGEKDWMKYETARRLYKHVDKIRAEYRNDFKSKEMRIRQRATALYFIDKLALRAGNEKDEDTADTVGCCSLRVEHIKLSEKMGDQEFVVEFDFLGKDSIRYYNKVCVEKRVFKNLQLFVQNKSGEDDLFDRLNTTIMNQHLHSLMDGLTAKVFRTFNASKTLQEQLDLLTVPEDNIAAKMLSYNRANRAVAVLCNHQRAAPKNFDKQMQNLQDKIEAKKETIKEAKRELKAAKSEYKACKTDKASALMTRKSKAVERLEDQLNKLEVSQTDKDENKEIALGTSKLNYLDPRISVAWCKKWDVPIEKVYNKTQRDKFAWAIDMAEEDYTF